MAGNRIMRAMSSAGELLLTEIDRLAYPGRMRLLAARARVLASAGELAAVLDELNGGDPFQREIAVFMAIVARYQPAIRAALGDPVWSVRRPAVSGWLRFCSPGPEEIAGFVLTASWQARRHVFRLLRRLPGTAIADGLIDAVRERFGDVEAAALLPSCSAGTLERLLPELGYTVWNWAALGDRFPAVVLGVAERQLAELPVAERGRWWGRFGDGVIAAAATEPGRVFDLLEASAPLSMLPGSPRRYRALAAADGGRLIALLAAPGRERWVVAQALRSRALLRPLARLEVAELAPLARRLRTRDEALAALLEQVAPSRRAELYAAAYADVDRSQARPADEILRALPRAARAAEARRVLALGPVADDAVMTLLYTSFLPWEQARPALISATTRSAADERATGYELLIECAALSGEVDVVTEVIGYLRRIRNEQDPVRARVLTALAGISPRLIDAAAAERLEQIAADTLAARDASAQTLRALSDLVVAVLAEHVGSEPMRSWSLRTLERMFGDRLPWLGSFHTRLRRGQEAEVFAAVREWLTAGVRRGSCTPLFAFTRALGRRAWLVPELQELLAEVIGAGNTSAVTGEAIGLWLADPAARARRVEEVLRADSSALALPAVWSVVCRRRTDLLDQALTGQPPRGKFLADGVRWVPIDHTGTRSWLPRQRTAYTALLAKVAGDAGAKIHERVASIGAAAMVPGTGWDIVNRYVGSPNTRLAEAALGALAATDRPGDALPILLGFAGSDQARVAIYAAGRSARRLAPERLGSLLASGPLTEGKVTSRKEALRLAALLSVPGVGGILREAWELPGQHRDVRAAVVSAARQRPHDPESWHILGEAAGGGPEDVLAVVAGADPLDFAPRHRRDYGALIERACGNADQDVTRAAWAALPRWVHWTPDVGGAVVRRIADLEERAWWRISLPTLSALLSTGRSAGLLPDLAGRLVALDAGPDGGGSDDPGRDRPASQRLRVVVATALAWADQAEPELDRSPLADAGRRLARQAEFMPLGASLLLAAVPLDGDHARQLAGELGEICDLLAAQPVTAGRIADMLGQRVARASGTRPEVLLETAGSLGRDSGLCAGLFAVAVASYGRQLGWPAPWRAHVRQLRDHQVPDVRVAALEVAMADE